jgi:hypothetical protein
MTTTEPPPLDDSAADVEAHYHNYVSSRIPWYVRLVWLLFWIFAVYYTLQYLFPALRIELTSPP